MLSLNERFADRAKRKAENEATSTEPRSGADKVGSVYDALTSANAGALELSDAEQDELRHRLANNGEPSTGYQPADLMSLYAGIGVVNPLVAPSALSGNGSGNAPENLTPDQIEAERQRVAASKGDEAEQAERDRIAADQAAAPGWNPAPASTDATDPTLNADGKPLTREELKKVLDARTPPVAYEGDANLATLQGLVKGQPAA